MRAHATLPMVLAICLSLRGASAQPAGDVSSLGTLPLQAPTAGTPEAAVLAGLPRVHRMTTPGLLYERRLRLAELGRLRRDLADLRQKLAASPAPELAGPLRLSLVGTMNREATIVTRTDLVAHELVRRGDR